jgi:hypothetical protein
MVKNKPSTGPFGKILKNPIDDVEPVLNSSAFVEVEPSEDEDIISPFNRGNIGALNNILNTSPFGGVTPLEEGEIVIKRAYYELQDKQVIENNGAILLKGPLQIIPIEGNSNTEIVNINPVPFGSVGILPGSTVTLYGTSDTFLAKMANSRDIDYGVWINGAVTFYKGYSIQLQLVKMGILNIWLQISKNF